MVVFPEGTEACGSMRRGAGETGREHLSLWADREVAVNAADNACDPRDDVPARKIGAIYPVRSTGAEPERIEELR
jgi:hypothetical protein